MIISCRSYFSRKAVVKRKLKKAKKTLISLCKNEEIVKVVGRVEIVGEPLIAPLSGRKCAYYHVLVEEKQSHGKSSHWHTLIEEEITTKFILSEKTGTALIDTSHVKSYLVQDAHYESGFLQDAHNHLEHYLIKHGHASTGLLGFNKTIRYKEGILEEQEPVAVTGLGRWVDGKDKDLPGKYKKVLIIQSYSGEPVYLSDDPDTLT